LFIRVKEERKTVYVGNTRSPLEKKRRRRR
jgi:hypothetical protein